MTIVDNGVLMKEIIESMDYMVRVMDADHKVIYMNKRMRELFGHTLGHVCYSLLGRCERCEHCVTRQTIETGQPDSKYVLIGDSYYNVISSPVSTLGGKKYSIELIHDITDQKEMEDELLNHYEKLKADIEFAKHIQYRALPLDGVYWNAWEINSLYRPSEDLGGDLYDLIKMNETESLLYIADVSGHGITSSLFTMFLRQMLRGQSGDENIDLKEIIELLYKNYLELRIDKEQYLTILFCLYNQESKEVSFLNAGHNCLPIVVKSNGELKEIHVSGLPVCNLMENIDHSIIKIPVESGDRIILYTDGITEARNSNNELFETERILETIKNNIELDGKSLANKIIEDVETFTQKPIYDDMAIVVGKII